MDEIITSLLEIIADSYSAQHRYAEALKYYKDYKVLSDTIYNAEKARIVAELQYAYEAEKKDKEIQLLKKEEERQRIVIILISVAALAAISLVVVLFLSKKLQAERHRAREAHLEVEHEKAQLALASSQRELVATTSFLQQKNKLLEALQEEVASLSAHADQSQQARFADMTHALTQAKLLTEDDWEQFRQRFEKVYPGFFFRLREQFYDLTPAETRLMALTHLNLSTREIASMLGVSDQTVYKTRQRLRAKIGRSAEMGLRDIEADVA
jgi:lipopolysaccharide export system protein LptC